MTANIASLITGATSPATAIVVDDYPYGFQLRTQIRYWVETKPGYGQRFVSQTRNPKNGQWNKPKASTYSQLIVMGREAGTGYVKYLAISLTVLGPEGLEQFAKEFWPALDRYQREFVKGFARFALKRGIPFNLPEGESL